jgi:hypothetical protein
MQSNGSSGFLLLQRLQYFRKLLQVLEVANDFNACFHLVNSALNISTEDDKKAKNAQKARYANGYTRIAHAKKLGCKRLKTDRMFWRRMQSGANPSLPKIPVNREKYREFWPLSGPGHAYPSTNTRVNRF